MRKRISRQSDLPALRALWATAFGDGADYIDRFFTVYWRPERMLVLEADGAPRAMAAWFDMPLVSAQGATLPAAYLYAVATEPPYRGRGLAGQLLDYAAEYLAGRGYAALTTVPASPSLRGFFAGCGFSERFSLDRRRIDPDTRGEGVEIFPVNAAQYGRLRESRLAGGTHVACSGDALGYQAAICDLTGGGLYRVGESGCACAEVWGDALIVKELLVPEGETGGAAAALLARHPAARCEVRTPCAGGAGEAFAMLRELAPLPEAFRRDGYFGLAFD